MPHIKLQGVRAQYELLTVRDYNLKRQLVEVARRRVEPPEVINALNGIDLDVAEGSRLGLVGPNGAGKSTLLAVMSGLLPPTTGSIDVDGRVLALLGGSAAGLDQEATGRDNIVSMGVQLGESPAAMRKRIDDIADFSGLGGRIDHPVYSYSTGMQTRLRFSILTSMRPDILLLDEGLGTADAEFAERAGRRLEEFVSAAGILVLASHGRDLLHQQCDTAIWLHQGTIMRSGQIDAVLDEYQGLHSPAPEAVDHEPDKPNEADQRPASRDAGDPNGEIGGAADQVGDVIRSFPGVELPWRLASVGVPYTLTEVEGAEHLLVFFPGVGIGPSEPRTEDEQATDAVHAHRLVFGADANRLIGAGPDTSGVRIVTSTIERVAAQLSIPRSRISCIGHSVQGTFALYFGLAARVGDVFVGAPCIRLGSAGAAWKQHRGDGSEDRSMDQEYRRLGFHDEGHRSLIDSMIWDTAVESRHALTITIVVSHRDIFYSEAVEFEREMQGHPSISCVLLTATYDDHTQAVLPFERALAEHLSERVGISFDAVQLRTHNLAAS